MKILKFPMLEQTYDYDCGAETIQMVLSYWGIDMHEDEIIRLALTNKKTGTPVEGFRRVCEKAGVKVEVEEGSIDCIKECIDDDTPVIVRLQAWRDEKGTEDWREDWKDGHYVVAIGYDDKKIYFADPWVLERVFLEYDELLNRWHDYDPMEKRTYTNLCIIIKGKKPVFHEEKIVHMD